MELSDVKTAMQQAGVDAETIREVVALLGGTNTRESNVVYFVPSKLRSKAAQK